MLIIMGNSLKGIDKKTGTLDSGINIADGINIAYTMRKN